MKTVTIRDFRTRPKQVRDSLRGEREALLTANGRPVAVLVPVDAGTVDETLETIRRARGVEALRAIRRESRARGLDRLPPAEIDAIVTRARRGRRSCRLIGALESGVPDLAENHRAHILASLRRGR